MLRKTENVGAYGLAAYEELKSEVMHLNSSSEVENMNHSLSNEDKLLE